MRRLGKAVYPQGYRGFESRPLRQKGYNGIMKVTKYEHACLVVEESPSSAQPNQDRCLVIDPGNYTKSLPAYLNNVSAIVITHVHADHFDPENLKRLVEQNTTADIFCTEEVAKQLSLKNVQIVTGGSSGESGPFRLSFFGGQHALIHPSWPVAQNVGVMVNNKLYYPGDSFVVPGTKVQLLALPVSAPWLKLAETMDFLTAIKPRLAFPTHNALLSNIGEDLVEGILSGSAQSYSGLLKSLPVGQSIEI